MSNVKQIQSLIGHGDKEKRIKDDFYATPQRGIEELLNRETFEGEIWEPACGDGAISKKLIEKGYNVFSSDIVNRGYGDAHFDFLNQLRPTDNVVTNPPFNISTKFTLHALNLARRKVAILNKLSFLEGKERRDKLYSLNKLKTVYVFSERLTFNNDTGGMLAFAWFVFDKEYDNNPTIKFI